VKPILFGEWLPDQPALGSNGLRTAVNCYPGPLGYRPVGTWVQDVPAGPEAFLGGASFTSPTGVISVVGGSATSLYRVFSGQWTVLKSGFNVQTGGRWRFAQFGGLAIATNGVDPMQKIDLTTGTTSNLAGSPPKARILAVVKDFLVAGVLDGQTNVIGWSGINNAEYWTYGQNQSDYNIMPSGGDVNGIFGGEFGLILQRSRITRMEYVGGNDIFVINEISSNLGCVSQNSVVQHGILGWFLSDNGFMMWDGAQLVPIGSEKIDRYFLANYNRASWAQMSAAVDIPNQVVVWSMGDRMFCYHWVLGRWTTINLAAQIVFSGVTRSISIDEQDLTVGAADDVLDTPGLDSLDADRFKGGNAAFFVVNTSNALGKLTGTPMAASWTLPDVEIADGRESQLRLVRPETDALTGMTLAISCRARLGDASTANSYTTVQANGDMPVRERGRYTRMSLTIAAGTVWTYARGLEPQAVIGARR
jgi:hypothetical protein